MRNGERQDNNLPRRDGNGWQQYPPPLSWGLRSGDIFPSPIEPPAVKPFDLAATKERLTPAMKVARKRHKGDTHPLLNPYEKEAVNEYYNNRIDFWLRTADGVRAFTRALSFPVIAGVTIGSAAISGGWGGPFGYFAMTSAWAGLKVFENVANGVALHYTYKRENTIGSPNRANSLRRLRNRTGWAVLKGFGVGLATEAIAGGIGGAHIVEIAKGTIDAVTTHSFDELIAAATAAPFVVGLTELVAANGSAFAGKEVARTDNNSRRALANERTRAYGSSRRGIVLRSVDTVLDSKWVQLEKGPGRRLAGWAFRKVLGLPPRSPKS